MTDELLIRVENVSKRFCRSLKRSLWYGVQDLASEFGDLRYNDGYGFPKGSSDVQLRPSEFWAVKDVSFELRRGECLGLIGRNGAGKTTLLRMLNGLIKPDTGSIQIHGNVGSIIALGAGFNPSLTGRENIRVAASVLGLTQRRTKDVIDEVIEFSELGEFIDSPVQSYSSGMQIRLGFSVTTALDPDILILDEVLAVGDVAFRTKCFNHMATRFRDCATIFVSHNMPQISRVSTKAAYMKGGSLQVWDKDVNEGIYRYHEDAKAEISKMCVDSDSTQILHLSLVEFSKYQLGQGEALGERAMQLEFNYDTRHCDKAVKVEFNSKSSDRVKPLVVFSDQEMTNVLQISPASLSVPSTNGPNSFVVPFDSTVFSGGYYWISVTIICCATGSLLANYRYALQFVSQSQPMYAPIYFQ